MQTESAEVSRGENGTQGSIRNVPNQLYYQECGYRIPRNNTLTTGCWVEGLNSVDWASVNSNN